MTSSWADHGGTQEPPLQSRNHESRRPRELRLASMDPHRPLVLVADDSRLVTELIRRWLQQVGAIVLTASDGNTALQMGLDNDLDLALVDHVLPGRVGSEVVQEWRRQGREFAVIMISAIADAETQVESLALGANAYLAKPISADELLEEISFVLGRSDLKKP